ncbi:MAG: hypothetical protein LBK07_05585 [Tannerella sp.]|jgi:cell division protein FtsA|nr:hypothetical protein [Tannerella sp.]
MTNDNFIVAINLETSHFQGMIGWKKPDGTLRILARDMEGARDSMHRGCIMYNDEAAMCINRLIRKLGNIAERNRSLEQRLEIEKVYIGVGGQSLHSVEHAVAQIISSDSLITGKELQMLEEQCHANAKDMEEEVFAILPPLYSLDGMPVDKPLGSRCRQLKASYKLIAGWPLIRTSVEKAVAKAGLKLAGIIVSPVALADMALDADEKQSGCILISLGFGATSVVVYKNGALMYFAVVPFGHQLITKDLSEGLNLNDADAEALKNDYAHVAAKKGKASSQNIEYIIGGRKMDRHKTDMIAGARAREIIYNVYNLVKTNVPPNTFGGSVKLTGKGAGLKGMDDLVADRFKLNVSHLSVPGEWDGIAAKSDLATVGLLMKGTENCMSFPRVTQEPSPGSSKTAPVKEEEKPIEKDEDNKDKQVINPLNEKKGFKTRLSDLFKNVE